jgi:hypothetical protein
MLIIGGNFETGKPSGYVNLLAQHLAHIATVHNGGDWATLERICKALPDHDTVLWMPDVDNSRPKLINDIKRLAPHTLLITTKRNDEGRYSFGDLIARALKSHSGLMLELRKAESKVSTTLMDPLGNVFLSNELDVERVAGALAARMTELQHGTRVSSTCLGSEQSDLWRAACHQVGVPDEVEEFFNIVRSHAKTFHELIHAAVNPERLMGNASFRCESGFPAFRLGGIAYMSRRNIDKRDIGAGGFVPVSLLDEQRTGYWGDAKPSVDSPISIRLFNRLPFVRFMLHSHTYVLGAPMTRDVLACGDVREADAVLELTPQMAPGFAINLRGHGSLVGVSDLKLLRCIEYMARPMPEMHEVR